MIRNGELIVKDSGVCKSSVSIGEFSGSLKAKLRIKEVGQGLRQTIPNRAEQVWSEFSVVHTHLAAAFWICLNFV